jgi:hypothetical protein
MKPTSSTTIISNFTSDGGNFYKMMDVVMHYQYSNNFRNFIYGQELLVFGAVFFMFVISFFYGLRKRGDALKMKRILTEQDRVSSILTKVRMEVAQTEYRKQFRLKNSLSTALSKITDLEKQLETNEEIYRKNIEQIVNLVNDLENTELVEFLSSLGFSVIEQEQTRKRRPRREAAPRSFKKYFEEEEDNEDDDPTYVPPRKVRLH